MVLLLVGPVRPVRADLFVDFEFALGPFSGDPATTVGLLPRFRPAIGTLTGVTIRDTLQIEAKLVLDNTGTVPIQVVQPYHVHSFLSAGSSPDPIQTDDQSLFLSASADPGQTTTTTAFSQVVTSTTTGVNLADFIGTGNFSYTLQYAITGGQPSPFVTTFSVVPASQVTLVYTYQPVAIPEPSTFVLAGVVGLVGVGYGWRRSARRAS